MLPQPPRPIWETVSLTTALLVQVHKRAPACCDLRNTSAAMKSHPISLQNTAMKASVLQGYDFFLLSSCNSEQTNHNTMRSSFNLSFEMSYTLSMG